MADAIPLKIEAGQLGRFLSTDTVPTGNLGTGSASGTTYLRGDKTWATPAGGAGSTVGTTVLNFGAFPGKSDASVDVASAGIVAGSVIKAWLRPVASADHSADEHMAETLKVFGTYLSDGNMRIYGLNTSQLNEPVVNGRGGQGTRIYGAWNINWSVN